jgi:hypothetical protein
LDKARAMKNELIKPLFALGSYHIGRFTG